jgi:MFS family permease
MDPSSETKSTSRIHPNIWILSAGSFLTDVSSEMIANLLPLFLFSVLGVRTSFIGLIDGIAETTASLTKIYSGRLSDRLGARKPLTVAGYALSTLAKPFLYFASTWIWVLGVRFADRLGKGIRTAPRDALLASSAPAGQRGYAFGLHRAADTAGAFTGLAIAGLVIWRSQAGNALLTRETFRIIVLASIIPSVLAVLILLLGLREVAKGQPDDQHKPETVPDAKQTPAGSAWRSLDRRFIAFLGVMLLFTLGNSSDSFIILRAQERGLNVLQVIGMLLTFNAIYSVLSGPGGALSDRVGRRRLLLTGWGIYSLVYLGLATARSGWQVWVLFGVYGVFYAMTEGVAKALVADLVQASQRGTAYGLFNAAIGLTALPASLIAGLLWQGAGAWKGFGPAAPFIFGALMSLAACLLLGFGRNWKNPKIGAFH